jgi:hypothetical protein
MRIHNRDHRRLAATLELAPDRVDRDCRLVVADHANERRHP